MNNESDKTVNTLVNLPEIPDQIIDATVATYNDLSQPIRTKVGETMGNLFELVFGGLNTYVEKKKVSRKLDVAYYCKKQEFEHENSLKSYIQEITDKVESIPYENLIEPKLEVVGPALEASKYYIDSALLRNMFSNLVTSSMNIVTKDNVHPSFVEIIKQLSTNDAIFLRKYFLINLNYPICKISGVHNNGNSTHLCSNLTTIENNDDVFNGSTIEICLNNLERLGLIRISYNDVAVNVDYDNIFKKTKEYMRYEYYRNFANDEPIQNKDFCIHNFGTPDTTLCNFYKTVHSLKIVPGFLQLTQYGIYFINTCCR